MARVRRPVGLRDDDGYVTAETAMVVPSLVLVLLLMLWALAVAGAQIRCVDAARTAVREAARGDTDARVMADARAAAPAGADVSIAPDGDLVRVTVRSALALPGPFRWHIGAARVSATAVAESESALARRGAVCGAAVLP